MDGPSVCALRPPRKPGRQQRLDRALRAASGVLLHVDRRWPERGGLGGCAARSAACTSAKYHALEAHAHRWRGVGSTGAPWVFSSGPLTAGSSILDAARAGLGRRRYLFLLRDCHLLHGRGVPALARAAATAVEYQISALVGGAKCPVSVEKLHM
ncbi:hypothetical protein BC834DRAFT_906763 [Gloeopeniophorella convolvens]|nr:hypothetical protein BC834DRAFT_906763 [Gloeopeniophorella convolvens]